MYWLDQACRSATCPQAAELMFQRCYRPLHAALQIRKIKPVTHLEPCLREFRRRPARRHPGASPPSAPLIRASFRRDLAMAADMITESFALLCHFKGVTKPTFKLALRRNERRTPGTLENGANGARLLDRKYQNRNFVSRASAKAAVSMIARFLAMASSCVRVRSGAHGDRASDRRSRRHRPASP